MQGHEWCTFGNLLIMFKIIPGTLYNKMINVLNLFIIFLDIGSRIPTITFRTSYTICTIAKKGPMTMLVQPHISSTKLAEYHVIFGRLRGSNIGRNPAILTKQFFGFVQSLQANAQIVSASFRSSYNLLFSNNPAIQSCIF